MFDFAFDKKTLGGAVLAKDLAKNPLLAHPSILHSVISKALVISTEGFQGLQLNNAIVKGKALYQFANLHDELVIRKLGRNIRRLTHVKQSDRDTIIRSIKTLLEEGHAFRVYRLDIRSFYESISRVDIGDKLRKDAGFPPVSLSIWDSFDEQLSSQYIKGMPRGLAISAVISEYLMRKFDGDVRKFDGIYYYARYVDDIFILTTAEEDEKAFKIKLDKYLPNGMNFNFLKTKILTFDAAPVPAISAFVPEHRFDFLGYEFSVSAKHKIDFKRSVRLDISKPKIRRMKTRLVLSLRAFAVDNNFSDLTGRLKVLSGNYNIYDRHSGHRRNVGIYFNYNMIDLATSASLQELDKFWKSLVLTKSGKMSIRLTGKFSKSQINSLLSHSFYRSFSSRTFYHFKPSRVGELTECWVYA